MRLMILACVIALTLFALGGHVTRAGSESGRTQNQVVYQDQDEQIVKILTNKALWRDDFPSLLKMLNSLNATGETKLSVLVNEAYGERKFSSREIIGQLGEVHSLMRTGPSFKTDVQTKLTQLWNQPLDTVTVAGQPTADDGSLRVSITSSKGAASNVIPPSKFSMPEFLAPGLTVSFMKQQNGEPERTTTQVVANGEDERRPVILTLYHYAGDAIVFGVSDMSPTPQIIDRAILDTAKISRVIFSNRRN